VLTQSLTRSNPIAAFLARQSPLILDGALATELERRGADLRDPLWSAKVLLEQPGLIREVHLDYFEAGADVATTASYQATFAGFARRGIDGVRAAALMRASVQCAASARDEFWAIDSNRLGRLRPLVAASVGPYGAMLADGSEYRGQYGLSIDALMNFHRPRIRELAAAGPDLFALETIPGLDEAVALARVLEEFPTMSAWLAFSCKDGTHSSEGQPIRDCVAAIEGFPQIVSVGVNCTAPEHMLPLLAEMRVRTDKPLLAYPNAGGRYDAGGRQWLETPATPGSPATPVTLDGASAPASAGFAAAARHWHDAGAQLIGGCCRTTPDDIRAIRAWAVRSPVSLGPPL
jgi:homocysteine S-methyltransferase